MKKERTFRKGKEGKTTPQPTEAVKEPPAPTPAPKGPQTYAHEAKPPLDLSKVLPTHQITPKFKFI